MTAGAAKRCPTQPSTIAAQYEALRVAALGEALPPEARSGLMLFLRRGMWGWALSLAVVAFRIILKRGFTLACAMDSGASHYGS